MRPLVLFAAAGGSCGSAARRHHISFGMQRDDAWELRPGDNGPETAAPDATSARHFVDELVKYTGHGNEAAGVKMKTLAMHLLNEQGWENVRDIRESLTATMLSTAMAQLEVGAGYAKQFQKYLGGPDGPWEAKKPKSLKNEREWEPTREAKAMKFDVIAETSSGAGAVGAEVLQCLVVPPDVFDGVFGENIHVEFPYQHALKRTKQTEVVNRYVMYTIFQLGYVAVGAVSCSRRSPGTLSRSSRCSACGEARPGITWACCSEAFAIGAQPRRGPTRGSGSPSPTWTAPPSSRKTWCRRASPSTWWRPATPCSR